MRYELVYVGGRLTALASRPLMLLALNYWGGNDIAAAVAIVYLICLLATAASSFDTHRRFYQAYFGHEKLRGVRYSYHLYSGTIIMQIATVSPLLAAFIFFWFTDPVLALLVAVYFGSERLADEAQRFLIFTGHRQEWGKLIIIKAFIQFTGVCGAAFLLGPDAVQVAVAFLLAGNLAAYHEKLSWRYLPKKWRDWKACVVVCLNQRIFWLLSMLTSTISYLDRILVMFFQQSDMAIYTILVSSMSVMQNAVEYFFVSQHRREILQGELWLVGVLFNRRFHLALGISAFTGCFASWVMIRLYHGQNIEYLELVPIVLLSQFALSVTLVLREMIYWNYRVSDLVWVEGIFIACTLVAALVLRATGHGYEVVLGVISVFLTLRMGFMVWGIVQSQKNMLKVKNK